MRKYIGTRLKATLPKWQQNNPRYSRLEELDRLLDGTYYDHLTFCYYQLNDGSRTVPILERRPSVVLNIYGMLADQMARKLFGGNHAPLFRHTDKTIALKFQEMREEADLDTLMIEAMNWGSVGSCAITFKILPNANGKAKVVTELYKAKRCQPSFDATGELKRLRIAYPISGTDCMLRGYTHAIAPDEHGNVGEREIKPGNDYWWVVDLTSEQEIHYKPIGENIWDPTDVNSKWLVVDKDATITHDFGFVPAVWVQNRRGKENGRDGYCYWERAIPLLIDADYTMSQAGAGCRYNVAPQVVLKGSPVSFTDPYGGAINKNPDHVIQFESGERDPDGITTETGDAHLLEMTGKGIEITIEFYVKTLIIMALKVICASLKDPQKITTAMSGKAMEFLEQEMLDLLEELRTNFGNAFLKLNKLIALAAAKIKHPIADGLTPEQVDELTLKWPPLIGLGADEIQQMAQGLVQLVTPVVAPAESPPTTPSEQEGDSDSAASSDADVSAIAAASPAKSILTIEQATDYVESRMDLPRRSANRNYEPAPIDSDDPAESMEPPEPQEQDANGGGLLAESLTNPIETTIGILGT